MFANKLLVADCIAIDGAPQNLTKRQLTEIVKNNAPNAQIVRYEHNNDLNKWILLLDSSEAVEYICNKVQEEELNLNGERHTLTYSKCDETSLPERWLKDEQDTHSFAGGKQQGVLLGSNSQISACKDDETPYGSIQSETEGKLKLTNLPDDIDQEYLEMFFEQLNTDIRINSMEFIENDTEAIIEFDKPEVNDWLLQKQPFNIDGHMVSAEIHMSQQLKQDDAKLIEVTTDQGVLTEKSLRTIKMYFGNKGRSSGGKIEEFKYFDETETIQITFDSPEVAKAVATKRDHAYKGHPLKVVLIDEDLLKRRQEAADRKEKPKAIVVKNLPHGIDNSTIELTFEDADTFGVELRVVNVEIDKEKNTAVVEFEDSAAVDIVLQQNEIEIEGQMLDITVMEEHLPNEQCTVIVTGPVDFITDKASTPLKMYFNNKRRSGGENVTDVCIIEPGVAEITFESAEVARQVVEKDHSFKSQPIEVALKASAQQNTQLLEQSNKILITGVNEEVRETLALHLEDMFEDVSVLKESPGKDETTVILELNAPGSAQKIAKQQNLLIEGCSLGVTVYRDEPVSLCTIQVKGLPDIDKHLDALKLHFKNRNRSGGGPVVKYTADKYDNVAYVTFESEEVAQRVVEKTDQYFKGQLLDISMFKPNNADSNKEKTKIPKKVLISDLPNPIDKDYLELFFEDLGDTCEMQIENIEINTKDNTVIVEFHEQAAVDFILEHQPFRIQNKTISIQVYHEEEIHHCTIEVHGPDTIEKCFDKMLLYFKNAKRSGGGVIVNSYIESAKNVAHITFENQEVAERVLANDHSKQGYEVKLLTELSEGDEKIDQNITTVKVRGVPITISTEMLTLYFESEKRSGGGPILSIRNDDEDENVFFIEFEKSKDARNVVERKHELRENSLHAILYVPLPFYDNKILIKGLRSTKDALFLFLEATAKAEPISIDYHEEEEGTVLVTMKQKPDFEKLEKVCMERTLEGAHLTVSKVQVSNCIYVSNLGPDITKDTIQFYFENKRKSGGGDVEKVVMNQDEDEHSCLVFFEDCKVIDSILEGKHTLGNKLLEVRCFQKELGRPEGQSIERVFKVPQSVEIRDANTHKVKFVAKSQENAKHFERELRSYYTEIEWPTENKKHVRLHSTLTKDVKGCFKIAKTWESRAKSEFAKQMDAITLYRIDVLQDIKQKVMTFLQTMQIAEPNQVALFVENEQKVIFIAGKRNVADNLKLQIDTKVKEIIDEAEKERQKVTEIFTNLRPIETKMIIYEQLPQTLEKEFDDLKVLVSVGENKIKLQGLISSVRNAKLAIYDKKSKFEVKRIDNISKLVCTLLQDENISSAIRQSLMSNGIKAVWETHGNEIEICCSDPGVCEKVAKIVRSFFQEDTISIERGSVPDLETDKWRSKVSEIHSKYKGKCQILLSDDLTKISICGTADVVAPVKEEIQRFLKSNSLITKRISQTREAHRFLEKNCKTDLEEISKKSHNFVTIRSLDQYKGFEIRGLEKGVQEATVQLEKLLKRIVQRQHTVSKPGIAEHIRSPKGKDSIHAIETTLSCVIAVDGDEENKQMNDKIHDTSLRASCDVFQGTTIYVWQGDITELDADVLINPSDSKLGFSGGLGKAILSKGGPTIKHECENYLIREHKELNDGEIFMSTAGNLKASNIAHIKSQQWAHNKDMDKDLESTVFKCLIETDRLQKTSVAIPAIGCGVNGFPVDVATSSIVNSLKRMLMEYQDSSICEIYLCDMKDGNVNGFTDALCNIFGGSNVSLNDSGKTSQSSILTSVAGQDDNSSFMGARPKRFATQRKSNNPARRDISQSFKNIPDQDAVAFGNIVVTVEKGEIAKQTVDAIVNTTAHNLDLRNGAVSQTLLKAAGQEIQDEVRSKYPKGLDGIDVAVTGGYKLNCEFVFHTALSNYNEKKQKESIKALHKLMKSCLVNANQRSCKSIAFPAIGTGSLGYPRNVVAEEMFKAITKFQKDNPSSSIKDVRFIVYQMDSQTVKAFDEVQTRMQKDARSKSFTGSPGHDTSVPQAESSSYDTSSGGGTFSYGSITLIVKQGDITKEDTECIVNSTNADLNLALGKVSKTLMEKGGRELIEEIENHKSDMKKYKIATTLAPGLPCKNIIHVVADSKDLASTVKKCLKEAESVGIKSIAIPAFGTGNLFSGTKTFDTSAAASDIARNMVKAVREFSKTQPKCLIEVRFVIFQKELLQELTKAAEASSDPKSLLGNLWKGVKDVFGMSAPSEEKSSRDVNVDSDFNSVNFVLFALNDDTISKAIKKLENSLEKEIHTKVIDDHTIRELEDHQIDEMNGLAAQCHVQMQLDKNRGFIKLAGLVTNVMVASDKIQSLLRDAERMELMKNIAQWFFIEVTKNGEVVQPYEKDINLTIETAYRHQKECVTFVRSDGIDYIIDFASMEEYPEHDKTDVVKVMRRDLVKGGSFELPAHWDDMQGGNLRVVVLKNDSKEYTEIEQKFKTSAKQYKDSNGQLQDYTVEKIERVQNKTLWEQFQTKKKQLEEQNPTGTTNERELWHGTAADPVDSINAHGFNRSFCGKNATVFGDGVYFAIQARYSCQHTYSRPDAQGIKRMYLCKVLTGEYAKGERGMRVPPPKPSGGPNALYDSVTNDLNNPSMFIIFNDTQACSEYLIYFKE